MQVLPISFRHNEKSTTSANYWNWFRLWLSRGKDRVMSLLSIDASSLTFLNTA
jgi:hypothetical protein